MNLSPYQKAVAAGAYKWLNAARPNQIVDETRVYKIWLWLAGRGFGKSKCIYEHAWLNACTHAGKRIIIVLPTIEAITSIALEGESGLMNIVNPDLLYGGSWDAGLHKTDKAITFLNGSKIRLIGAEKYERMRGKQSHDTYLDELAAFSYVDKVWQQVKFFTRLKGFGENKIYIATTPRPIPLVKALIKDPSAVVIRGKTIDNIDNLGDNYLSLIQDLQGTRVGRQELDGEIIDDFENALWTWETVDKCKIGDRPPPDMQRIVVAVDPSGNNGNKGDATGIVVAGIGIDGQYYVLADRSCALSPELWAKMAINAYHEFKADKIIAEQNYGGAMVESLLRNIDRNIPYGSVVATRGKAVRAEPIAALYTQGKVSHVSGLEKLESQMTEMTTAGFQGSASPDRVDALVWAITELTSQNGHIPFDQMFREIM